MLRRAPSDRTFIVAAKSAIAEPTLESKMYYSCGYANVRLVTPQLQSWIEQSMLYAYLSCEAAT